MADPIDTSKPAPNLDPEKVKQFQKGFNAGGPSLDAIKRRMTALLGGGDSD